MQVLFFQAVRRRMTKPVRPKRVVPGSTGCQPVSDGAERVQGFQTLQSHDDSSQPLRSTVVMQRSRPTVTGESTWTWAGSPCYGRAFVGAIHSTAGPNEGSDVSCVAQATGCFVQSRRARPCYEIATGPPKTAFLTFAAGEERVCDRYIDRFHVRRAEAFAGAAAGQIVGVARDPDRPDLMELQQRQEHSTRPLGEVPASGGWVGRGSRCGRRRARFRAWRRVARRSPRPCGSGE